MTPENPFDSFFMAGFECSTHRRPDGHRLDLLAATRHDVLAAADYSSVNALGLRTVRDGIRWHLVETAPGRYDWSSVLPMLRAARAADMQVIWDLCHYGWPDDLDIWSSAFVERFAAFAGATARLIRAESDAVPVYCPVNEISFWAWAGGEVARMNPVAHGRGGELKRQLVRAALAAVAAVREVDARARFVWAEPIINVAAPVPHPGERAAAETHRLSQFEAYDMLAGRAHPELGGRPDCLDIVGVNFYPENQWWVNGPTIPFGHHAYRPLRAMLTEVHERYGRPILISETGAEESARAAWLGYVAGEARIAAAEGAAVVGLCLYPALDYPGWDNGRTCRAGLLGTPDAAGERALCAPLAEELERQAELHRKVAQPAVARSLRRRSAAG